MIRVTIDSAEFEREWRAASAQFVADAPAMLHLALREGVEYARHEHTYRDKTGALTQSIGSVVLLSSDEGAMGELFAAAEHASFVEHGTRAHDIRPKAPFGTPKRARLAGQGERDIDDVGTHRVALRWYGADGTPHFARVVHHPGTRAMPFVQPAAVFAGERCAVMLDDAAARAFRFVSAA